MNQSITVAAYSQDTKQNDTMLDEMLVFAGKAAGVCYMPDNYFDVGIQNEDNARKRALSNAKNGHTSVYDHSHISLIIQTSKMICMLLNSFNVYTTSEKSARYTVMHGNTEIEDELYQKWIQKFQNRIVTVYKDIDDTIINNRINKKLNTEKIQYIRNRIPTDKSCDNTIYQEILNSSIL